MAAGTWEADWQGQRGAQAQGLETQEQALCCGFDLNAHSLSSYKITVGRLPPSLTVGIFCLCFYK